MRNLIRKKPVIEEVTDDLIEQQQVASAEQMRQQYVERYDATVCQASY